jgi:hypothetical protein
MTSRARAKQRRRAAASGEADRSEPAGALEGERRPARLGILGDAAIVLAAFAAASALAAAFGAANFGTALAFGQLGFALALAYVLVRRR